MLKELPPNFIASGAPFLSDSVFLPPGQTGIDRQSAGFGVVKKLNQAMFGIASLAMLVGISYW
jgi:hypothetical protein